MRTQMSNQTFRLRRALAIGASALAVAVAAVGAMPSAGAATSHPDRITLLVGSPHTAVYELTRDPNEDTVPPTTAPYQLVARAADGSSDTYPLSDAQAKLDPLRWSLSQNMLTALDYSDHASVSWWDLSTHTTGTLTIPAHSYVAASPRGVLYLTTDGVLHELTPGGDDTILSHPFTKRPSHMTARSSDSGVLIADLSGQAHYLTFAKPDQVRRLKTGRSSLVVCSAVRGNYAACTTYGAMEGRPTGAALLSLTGKAPMFAKDRRENFGRVGLIGTKTIAWTRFARATADQGPIITVGSLHRGSNHLVVAKHLNVAFGQVITAYGKVLVMPRKQHRIFASADGTTFKTIVTAPSS